jgi:hypothetical protein
MLMTRKRSPALSVTLFKSLPFGRHTLQALFYLGFVQKTNSRDLIFSVARHNLLLLKA